MEIRFLNEPNIVYECAWLIFKIVNHESYKDKRSYYASKYQTGMDVLNECFPPLSDLAHNVSSTVSDDIKGVEWMFRRNSLGSCYAFYLLHDTMGRPHTDIYSAADDIKAITKAQFFLNFYSILSMQDRRAKFDRDVKNYNDLINFISAMTVPDSEKWELCRFYNNFESARSQLASVIFKVGEAYYNSYELVENHIRNYTEKLEFAVKDGGVKYLNSTFGLALGDEINSVTLVPSPVLCTDTEYIYNFTGDRVDDYLYVGCYYDPIGKIAGDGEKLQNLCGSLRTLGDTSKLKILKILLQGPRYGQELAAILGISTATVSHHVSLLEEYEFIKLERRQNRVYYSVNREKVESLLDELEAELL